MTERDVMLNELAHGIRLMSEGIAWFDALDPEEQSNALLFLRHRCVQARAVAEDGAEGIRRAGLRPTYTPAVLITRGRINDQLCEDRLSHSPRRTPKGVPTAGRGARDRRRKSREHYYSDGCGHWWRRLSAAD
ncbi:DUF5958 family protein [Streptomyces sp. NPDC024089]|uniref:DUF5958 family protein n=1 Tax=Streptomyces sp. NPDC024089 TaxID=3154328 RepID=UPI0033C284C2